MMAGEVADELGDKDQGAGGGFGQAQGVDHLRGGQPAVGFNDSLGHVGQNGIGAAKGDDGEFRKE